MDVSNSNCYVLNFGWTEELPLPQLFFNLDNNDQTDLSRVRTTSPSNCFFVFIGGKYLSRLKDVVNKVEHVETDVATKPITYFAEKSDLEVNEDLNYIYLVNFAMMIMI